jgi:WD40 repeat protein
MKNHVGFVCALKYHNGNLYSGAKDGKLCQINIGNSQVTKTIEYPSLVRAIDCDDSGNLLVGQRDGTISYEDGSRTNIMYSHSDGEVWGLAQQADGTVVTSADDNKVMFWNPESRSFIKQAKVSDRRKKAKRGGASTLSKYPDSQCSRSVAVNDTYLIVAGNDGAVSVRNCSAPDNEIKLIQDSTEWIEVMAFSPNNEYLACGSHDNNIYVYNVNQDFALVGKCSAHNSYVMAMDWCSESRYIRSNCGAYELLFHTVPDCNQDPSGRSNTTGTTWASKTCKFQWETEGIYPSGTDGTHINGVAGSADGQLLATGDDYGLVCLFRDPCRQGGKPRSYRGHSEHVVRVMFGGGDARLFSVGGYDQTLMQWKRC